jgi:hypothetical protein
MRTFVHGSLLIILTGMMGGCSSGMGAKSDAPAVTHDADAGTCVMQSGGSNVLRLATPANSKCVAKDGSLKLTTPQFELDVWLVPGAQTVDQAIGSVGTQIASEFKDFKPDQTTDLTIAEAPAKRLAGTGHEADDGDNGEADVIVFKVGDHIFVACTHDESLPPTARQGMLTTVQTAETP